VNIIYYVAGLVLLMIFFSCSGEKMVKSADTGKYGLYVNAKNPSGSEFPGGRGPEDNCLFAFQALTEAQIEALQKGPFRNKASIY